MSIHFERYTTAHKGADYKNRSFTINGETDGMVLGLQYQSTEEVYSLSAHIDEGAKLNHACDVSGSANGSSLAFEFGGLTIYLTPEQLDQMQAHRPDVTGSNYIDITEA